jgi:isoaspartyl peptidase/L-asparaginase-like protein (Ntn-hydrolase superfamily)
MPETWAILIHGGAKTIQKAREQANRAGCLKAVEAGAAVLAKGGSAIEATVAAIKVLEDDATFNAGYGAVLNADGEVELDAALMDGQTLDVGAVAALRTAVNPIEVAHALLRDAPVLLVGEGAGRYAEEKGLALCEPGAHIPPAIPADEACDTVGCVAMDTSGNLAAGTSTGGLQGVRPGRVGDSPIAGCGLAAENGVGAVSFSGDGESIVRLTLAARLMHDLQGVGADGAADRAIKQMPRVGGEAGCIVLDASGNPGVAHNSTHFAFAFASAATAGRSFLHADEFDHER